jgi:hypothetical protein
VECEYLHARLGVGVVGRLEAQLLDAELPEELVQHPDEITEGEAAVCNHALDLVEMKEEKERNMMVPGETRPDASRPEFRS